MNILITVTLIALVVLLFYLGFKLGSVSTNPPVPREEYAIDAKPILDWQKLYGEEQMRFDRMRTLFERQRTIDDHSAAVRNLELRSIEHEYRELCPPAPTRRSEP